ncbi:hypothetical protein [Comamonas aquatica]|uniref:hypothetical protein n=1 Tax=Comamonas aquatica TaxID=225991 RepID=UPI001B36EAAD|nr:hypothetical protein [Comamonas aquatica]QTX22460.1 hypothetical protein KAQ61_08650 [Comamonas aquatica]
MIEPYIRKIIFVDDSFLEDLRHRSISGYQQFEAPDLDTKIITLPANSSEISELVSCMSSSDIRAGEVMVRAPYIDQFIPLDAFTEDCAVEKYRLWVQLCLALGAKSVSITNIEEITIESDAKSELSASISGKAPLIEGEAGFKKTDSEQHRQARQSIMRLNAVAEGSEPNLVEAERILKRHGLQGDNMFRSIFDMRSVSSNRLTKQEFSLDLTSDIKKVMNASLKAKVKVMSELYSGRIEIDSVKKALEKGSSALKLSVTVEF